MVKVGSLIRILSTKATTLKNGMNRYRIVIISCIRINYHIYKYSGIASSRKRYWRRKFRYLSIKRVVSFWPMVNGGRSNWLFQYIEEHIHTKVCIAAGVLQVYFNLCDVYMSIYLHVRCILLSDIYIKSTKSYTCKL